MEEGHSSVYGTYNLALSPGPEAQGFLPASGLHDADPPDRCQGAADQKHPGHGARPDLKQVRVCLTKKLERKIPEKHVGIPDPSTLPVNKPCNSKTIFGNKF